MAHYAVGDIQGCYGELMNLLDQVAFNPKTDKLWVVGDMVSRGPDSHKVLRFLYEHRACVNAVLGNHDLHLIAIAFGLKRDKPSDCLDRTLRSDALQDWVDWLRTLPLCFYDETYDVTMVHAGIAPPWSIRDALSYSQEVEDVLRSKDATEFLGEMYGNTPLIWSDELEGMQRLRCITNYFTRMRALCSDGSLDFRYKGDTKNMPAQYYPWFKYPQRRARKATIIFGHWASLGGYVDNKYLFGLDTGCVWGRMLTLMNVETKELFVAESLAA